MDYGKAKKFLFDKVKKIAGKIPEAIPSVKNLQKTVIAAEALTVCVKPLINYLPRSDLKTGEN